MALNTQWILTAKDNTKRAFSTAERNAQRVNQAVSRLGVIAGGVGVAGLAALVVQARKSAVELGNVANKLGIATDQLSGLQQAARDTNVDTNKFNTALQRLGRRTSEAAQGTGEAQGAIKELGLDARELAKLTLDEQFRRITAAFEGVENQTDKVRLAFKLFDTEGVDLVRTLGLGVDGLDESAKAAQDLGVSLNDLQVGGLLATDTAIQRLGTATKGLGTQLALTLTPSIESTVEFLTGFVKKVTEASRAVSFFGETIFGFNASISSLALPELEARAVALTDKIENLDFNLRKLAEANQLFDETGGFTGFAQGLIEQSRDAINRLEGVREQIQKINDLADKPTTTPVSTFSSDEQAKKEAELLAERERKEAELRQRREEAEAASRLKEFDALRQSFLSREALELEAFERRKAIIEQNTEEESGIRSTLLLQNEQRLQEALVEIERAGARERAQAVARGENLIRRQRSATVRQGIQLLQAFAGKSKAAAIAAIALNKGLAIAQTIQNTAAAAVRALAELGPIAGPPVAAKIKAFGAAQVALIAATGLAEAGSVSSGGADLGTPGNPLLTESTGTSTAPTPVATESVRRIEIVGVGGRLLDEETVRQLVDEINEASGDGAEVKVVG